MSHLRKLTAKVYIQLTEKLYSTYAWAYEFIAWTVSIGLWKKWRLDTLEYLRPGNVLEIGFGTGALLVEMRRRGYDVAGLELSQQMLRITKRRSKRENTDVKILRASAEYIPFPDNCFRNILATFPSNYIYLECTLKEIMRVLAEDGCVILVGFGVVFKSGIRRWLIGWFLNKGNQTFVELFCHRAKDFGFLTDLIYHQGESYILPIVSMEKNYDD